MSTAGARRRLRVVVAGLAATVALSAAAPAPARAAVAAGPAATASSLVATPTNLATDEDKVEAARVLGINPGIDMLVLNDQEFVLSIWRQAPDDSFVKAEALRAYDTTDSQAAYAFIKTGIFEAAADDAQAEIAAARAKALRRSVAVTVGLDPADTELIEKSDRDFIFSVWQRVTPGTHVWTAARDAIADGTDQDDWTAFLTTGAQAAAELDMAEAIAKADAELAARLAAQQLATAKRSLLQLLLLPVTEELVNAPNRQYVLSIHSTAKGTEVLLAAQAALNAPDAQLDQALRDFIFTGGAAANARDEAAAAAKELANYRAQATAIRDAAAADGQQPNLVAAADQALGTNTPLALQTFLLKGQDTARALDKTRNEHTVDSITVQSSNLCLAVSGGSTVAGTHVLQWTCNGGAEQDWKLRVRSIGRYEIRNDHSKMCLAVGGGSKENGAHVLQWGCNDNTADQSWQLSKNAKGYTQLRNVNSGQCLAIGAASTEAGAHALQWPCEAGHAEQSWAFKARTVGQRIVNKNSGLCLSNGVSLVNGAHALQTACSDVNDSEWHLNPRTDGYSEIRNDRSNLCLAIGSGSKENGAHALQWTCGGLTHLEQAWKVTTLSNGLLEIRNVNSDQCLAIGSGSKEDGAHALQWPCGGVSHLEQAWTTPEN